MVAAAANICCSSYWLLQQLVAAAAATLTETHRIHRHSSWWFGIFCRLGFLHARRPVAAPAAPRNTQSCSKTGCSKACCSEKFCSKTCCSCCSKRPPAASEAVHAAAGVRKTQAPGGLRSPQAAGCSSSSWLQQQQLAAAAQQHLSAAARRECGGWEGKYRQAATQSKC